MLRRPPVGQRPPLKMLPVSADFLRFSYAQQTALLLLRMRGLVMLAQQIRPKSWSKSRQTLWTWFAPFCTLSYSRTKCRPAHGSNAAGRVPGRRPRRKCIFSSPGFLHLLHILRGHIGPMPSDVFLDELHQAVALRRRRDRTMRMPSAFVAMRPGTLRISFGASARMIAFFFCSSLRS